MPHQKKLSVEEKVTLVQKYLAGEGSLKSVARAYGVNEMTAKFWVEQYKADGVQAFLPQERNRVYSPELKENAIQDYLSGEGSIRDLCVRYKIRDPHIFREWLKVYNAHGDFNSVRFSGGGCYMKQGRDTTQEERIQIAKECIASGKNYGEMALRYNVSYQQVRTWTLRYEELGKAGLEDRRGQRKKAQEPRTPLEEAQIEIERLKHELHKAEMERDLLKKLDEVVGRDVYRK